MNFKLTMSFCATFNDGNELKQAQNKLDFISHEKSLKRDLISKKLEMNE